MPTKSAARRLPTSTRKTNLQVIPGALSLYRQGDVITFDLEGVEFSAPIDSVEMKAGVPLLCITLTLGVRAHHVKRVERRSYGSQS